MVKIIGAILIIISGFVLGKAIETKYKQKVEFWKEILSFMTLCESEIGRFGADLDSVFQLERQKGNKYSGMIADAVQYNKTSDPDMKLLTDMLSELRSVNCATQSKVFSEYEKTAEQKIENAKTELRKKGQTFFRLLPILFAGIAIVLW